MDTRRILRVVVASPSDVKLEREQIPKIAEAINKSLGDTFGAELDIIRWETDTGPGFDPLGPQALIDRKLRIDECDLLIVLFWAKFGTPVSDAASGTEHEFMTAYEAWRERGRPEIHVYFKTAKISQDLETLEQAALVQKFKRRIAAEGKYEEFATNRDFQQKVRSALDEFITRHGTPPRREPERRTPGRTRGDETSAELVPARGLDYRTLALEDVLEAREEPAPFSRADEKPEQLEVFSLAFFRDDLVAAGSDNRIFLWNRRKPKDGLRPIPHVDFVYSVAFSPDGQWLASGAQDGSVRIHNLSELHSPWPPKLHGDAVYSVAFSPDGSLLASGSYDRWVRIWDADDGSRRGKVKLEGRISSLAFSPTQPWLAIGDLDNFVWLWDYEAKDAEPQRLGEHASSVESVAFSPDGALVASAGLDKRIRLWDVERRVEKWAQSAQAGTGHDYLVRSVAFSPNGDVIASASWDKTVGLWSVADGTCLCRLPTDQLQANWHTDWIWSVAFSEDGQVLATAGSDGNIILMTVEERVPQDRRLIAAR